MGRRLIIPDPAAKPENVLYATDGDVDGDVEERGVVSSYPTPDAGNLGRMRVLPGGVTDPFGDLDAEIGIAQAGGIVRKNEDFLEKKPGGGYYWRRAKQNHWRGKAPHQFVTQPIPIQIRSEILRHCRVVSLPDGRAVLVYAYNQTAYQDTGWRIKSRVWDPELQQWSIAYDVTGADFSVDIAFTLYGQGSDSPAPCVTVFPDGEIVCVFSANPKNVGETDPSFQAQRTYAGQVYSSYDGREWQVKSRGQGQRGNGLDSTFALGVHGRDMVCMPSGRLVIVQCVYTDRDAGVTKNRTEAWTSDDRGISWADQGECVNHANMVPGSSLRVPAIVTARNGVIIGAMPRGTANPVQPFFSGDGINWDITRAAPAGGAADSGLHYGQSCGLCLDDEGYIVLTHVIGDVVTDAERQGLYATPSQRIEFSESDLVNITGIPGVWWWDDACMPHDGIDDDFKFHYCDPFLDADGSLQYVTVGRGNAYNSMTGIRGNEWSDLRVWKFAYDPTNAESIFWRNAVAGSWFCFDFPDVATAGSVVAGNTCDERGLYISDDGVNPDQYQLHAAGSNPDFRYGVIWNVLAWCESGGDLAADDVLAALVARDGGANQYVYIKLRLTTGSFRFYDQNAAVYLCPAITIPTNTWIEWLIRMKSDRSFQAWWRPIEPDRDAEWNQVCGSEPTLTQVATPDPQSFYGNGATANAESWWMQVADTQGYLTSGTPTVVEECGVDRFPSPYDLPEFDTNILFYTFVTIGRPAVPTTEPQRLPGGTGVAWAGSAGHPGDLFTDVGARYENGRDNIVRPPSKELRSRNIGDWRVVLDAGEGRYFLVDAVAAVGINFSRWSFQMADADVWAAPPVDVDLSDTGAADIDTRFADDDGNVAFTASNVEGRRVYVSADQFRPHQFADRDKQCWYMRATSGRASGRIWRVTDNGTDFLYLSDEPLLFVDSDTFVIFADRVAFDLAARAAHRYIRIQVDDGDNVPRTPNEQFYRYGWLCPGLKWEFGENAAPQFDWGFTPGWNPAVNVITAPGGGRASSVRGPSRRVVDVSFDGLPPARTFAADISGPWQRVVDLMEALDYGHRVCAFVPVDDATSTPEDFDEFFPVRLMGGVGGQHVAYMNREDVTTECIMDWVLNLSGISLQEEL